MNSFVFDISDFEDTNQTNKKDDLFKITENIFNLDNIDIVNYNINCQNNTLNKNNQANQNNIINDEISYLKEQFFNTLINDPNNLNSKLAFYIAESYQKSNQLKESSKWYSLCIKLLNSINCYDIETKDKFDFLFESYLRLIIIFRELKYKYELVKNLYIKATYIFPTRAEPYVEFGTYCNQNKLFDEAYYVLKTAKNIDYNNNKKESNFDVNIKCYGKYINDELSISAYWIGNYDESKLLLEEIINDNDFLEHKERLYKNLEFANNKLCNNQV